MAKQETYFTTDSIPLRPRQYQITIQPEQLGAMGFGERYNIKYAYLTGAMYKGIGY